MGLTTLRRAIVPLLGRGTAGWSRSPRANAYFTAATRFLTPTANAGSTPANRVRLEGSGTPALEPARTSGGHIVDSAKPTDNDGLVGVGDSASADSWDSHHHRQYTGR